MPGATRRGRSSSDTIEIPEGFFRNGWHLVLTGPEIATLFAIMDRTNILRTARRSGAVADIGVDLKEAVRWSAYDIYDSVYRTVHALDRFKCIELIEPMADRRSRSPDGPWVAYRLVYPPAAHFQPFERVASDVVRKILSNS